MSFGVVLRAAIVPPLDRCPVPCLSSCDWKSHPLIPGLHHWKSLPLPRKYSFKEGLLVYCAWRGVGAVCVFGEVCGWGVCGCVRSVDKVWVGCVGMWEVCVGCGCGV